MIYRHCKSALLIALVIFLSACSNSTGKYSYGYYTGKQQPAGTRKAAPRYTPQQRHVEYHKVQKGETLYSIAWAYGHDVRDVARWNSIRPPYTIYPEQRIRVKPLPKNTHRSKPPTHSSSSSATARNKTASSKQAKYSARKDKNTTKISWHWPTNGKIIGKYSVRDAGKKGLDIAGKKGQRIYAAAKGEIVYVGSGLRGYGRLIIIKHNDTYLSAYAHNRKLYVKENQKVERGQHIADMGSDEAEQAMLHFEVRRNGKPVDPLKYLPKRR
jgi:lipoprotein NlpD